ncbi:MAG: putative transporter permease protein [Sphingomonas bacterium]|jgi:peptide/nickel transport system permease protein|uniref:ABC transporter permease n=1 Tax=Sphingomonas bacterium TaxID=1895847 RepID=UPI00262231A6|nr:ABC transporter permease [Sphingomonas bacterium]MDB5707206.1 putative transporter permease protein [Sphingomonas bacterium]
MTTRPRLAHLSWPERIGGALVAIILLTMLLATVWTPFNPLAIDLQHRFAGPSAGHWLGTDQFGRDVLSRAMAGARISVPLALIVVACATTLGLIVGTLAGFLRGPVEAVLMTVNDALMAFPGLVLALTLVAVLGAGATSIVVALTIAYLPSVVRVVRASVLSIRTREYLEASRVMGNSAAYSMLRHVVPNTLPQVAVLATSMFGWVLLSESALGFLGVGIPAPAPTWGNMLAASRPYLNTAGWLAVVPGLCIAATLLGTNLLSDALRDRFDTRLPS